jgi:hypothetical protein
MIILLQAREKTPIGTSSALMQMSLDYTWKVVHKVVRDCGTTEGGNVEKLLAAINPTAIFDPVS